ncbi:MULTISPECIES: hypothetical protein [unclassified Sphingomonas]|uniref:hypothetical protein n=1 Tax=unclassified Sphingomonas TaxID=196159 RepID=UPI0006F49971|nr:MULTISPECIES: hypothetical protein [unclassified Sphingomonas]KQX20096.1 hypothetical protein ASD17_09385 [Sphingomonas sp. Root1294]KQY67347.1 hypothetical protein ASD39_09445 [Sphingomonas sp. Root50]KRB90724.1 hypothetical protein ASE22_10455 [Sphingomonas sp. Root720]
MALTENKPDHWLSLGIIWVVLIVATLVFAWFSATEYLRRDAILSGGRELSARVVAHYRSDPSPLASCSLRIEFRDRLTAFQDGLAIGCSELGDYPVGRRLNIVANMARGDWMPAGQGRFPSAIFGVVAGLVGIAFAAVHTLRMRAQPDSEVY